MAYKITWTRTAKKQFDNIVNFIEYEWSETIAAKFINRTNDILDLLIMYPKAGSIEVKRKRIRGFLLSKQVKLFYRVTIKELILLGFFDTRSNPDKKLRKLK